MTGPLRITFFGTYDETLHPRVQVLEQGLRARGHQVEVVNVPLVFDTAARVRLASQPWRAPGFALRVLATWARLLWRSRRVRRPDVVVVGYLGHFDVHLARARWRRAHVVVDHMVSMADTVRDRRIDRSSLLLKVLTAFDRAATRQADTVVVDTAEQATGIDPRDRAKVVVVPVGAPAAWFSAGAGVGSASGAGADLDRDPDEPLRVAFFGLYTPLQGAVTIGEAIGALRDRPVRWTMIGDGQDRAATEAAAEVAGTEVEWLDWVDAADLPALVADHDVCLGIFGTGPKALRVVPNKVYQGAAAGCAVVTSDTAPQRLALGDAALYVPPGDARALAEAVGRLAADRSQVRQLRAAARATAEARFTAAAAVEGLSTRLRAAHDGRMPSSARTLPSLSPNAALRWDIVRARVDQLAPTSVLELGAGQGSIGARLATRADYVGVEPDATSRATAQGRIDGTGVVVGDLAEVPADRIFDLACAFEVLEHIPDDKGALAEWVERVRPGGHVLVSVPADPERYGPADELVGHIRRYTATDLSALLESAGLEVVAVDHYGFPLGNVLEWSRDTIAKRRLARDAAPDGTAERTAGSGRLLQPPAWSGTVIWWATGPFRFAQRRFTRTGVGLVGLARRPG